MISDYYTSRGTKQTANNGELLAVHLVLLQPICHLIVLQCGVEGRHVVVIYVARNHDHPSSLRGESPCFKLPQLFSVAALLSLSIYQSTDFRVFLGPSPRVIVNRRNCSQTVDFVLAIASCNPTSVVWFGQTHGLLDGTHLQSKSKQNKYTPPTVTLGNEELVNPSESNHLSSKWHEYADQCDLCIPYLS